MVVQPIMGAWPEAAGLRQQGIVAVCGMALLSALSLPEDTHYLALAPSVLQAIADRYGMLRVEVGFMAGMMKKLSNNTACVFTGKGLSFGGSLIRPEATGYGLVYFTIYKVKGRPSDNPLIVHIADIKELPALVEEIPEAAKKLADAFWPGPLTIIMKKSPLVPMQTTGGLDTVAVRMPSDPMNRFCPICVRRQETR